MFDNTALKNLLDTKNIKQAQLARMTGISRTLICRYLTEGVQPKADKIQAIADALGVKVEYLLIKQAAPPPKMKLCFCPNCGVNLGGIVK